MHRKRQMVDQELTDHARASVALIDDLKSVYSEGQGGRGTLDFLRIVSDPSQTAAEYRRMLSEVGQNTWSSPVRPMRSIRWTRSW